MSSSKDAIRQQVGTLRRPMSVQEEIITGELFDYPESRQHRTPSPVNDEFLRRFKLLNDMIFTPPGFFAQAERFSDHKFRNLPHYKLKGVVFTESLNTNLINWMRSAIFGSKIGDDFPTVMLLLAVQLTVPGTNSLIFEDILTTDGDSLPETYLQVDGITSRMEAVGYENLSLLEASFIAAYAFGLAATTVDNMINSCNSMRTRFQDFYGKVMVNIPCSEKIWTTIKNLLYYCRAAITTWILIISMYETDHYSNPSFTIVRYLACEPLSYTGMHAYPLLLEVQMRTKRRLEDLITDLWSTQTKAALLQIIEIIQNFEIVQHSATKNYTFYRYARVVNPEGFFQKLQTKNCLELVYCLANIWSQYPVCGESNDPRRIVALNKLAEPEKRRLERLTTVIVQAYKQAEREIAERSAQQQN